MPCYSCEIDTKSYAIAQREVAGLGNVRLDLKPSPDALYDIHAKQDPGIYEKYVCFWLDAHWHTNPLYEEIKYITSNFKKFCIFIDDFTVPGGSGFHTDGYSIEKIKPYIAGIDSLKYYIPGYPSSDPCCSKNPCGYIVITNMDIETYNNLKKIRI